MGAFRTQTRRQEAYEDELVPPFPSSIPQLDLEVHAKHEDTSTPRSTFDGDTGAGSGEPIREEGNG